MPIPGVRDQVRRVRVTGRVGDGHAARLTLDRALGTTNLHPPGLPERAIVCVRSVRVAAHAGDLGGSAGRLREVVGGLAAGAARPFREMVGADATAVVFLDEAELLACLARDWRRGESGAWWWVGLLGGTITGEGVERVWLENVPFVAAAVELLRARGEAGEVVRAFAPAFVDALVVALAPAFGSQWGVGATRARMERGSEEARPGGLGEVAAVFLDRTVAPAVVVAVPELERAPRRLIALAVALHRRPDLALATDFPLALEQALTRWSMASRGVPGEPTAMPAGAGPDGWLVEASGRRSAPGPAVWHETAVEPDRAARCGSERAAPASHPVAARNRLEAERRDAAPGFGAEGTDTVAVGGSSGACSAGGLPLPPPLWADPVDSEYAGIFYLVTLALYLEIYGDFTRPLADREGTLPLADFLAALLVEAHGEGVREDPVWTVLALLADRSAELDSLGDAAPGGPLAEWYAEARSGLAGAASSLLGVEPEDALRFLCARRGSITLTAARLEVRFALADHPLAIRMAGLDRNPGWVPAAARVIEFHYV